MHLRVDMTIVPSQKKIVPGTIKRGQHLPVSPIEMLAAGQVSTSNKNACLDGAKLKSVCRTVQVLSSSPQCSALQHRKTQESA